MKHYFRFCFTFFVCAFFGGPLLGGSAFAQTSPPAAGAAEPVNEAELAKDSTTEINVKNADLAAIVRIFSKKTKRNYILDENLKGKVSIYLPGKVSSDQAIKILDSVLALKGFSSVPIGENLWKIVPAKDAKQSTIPTLTGESDGAPTAAMVTRLVDLKYVNADDIKQLVQPLISSEGLLNAYTGTNSLIMIDSEDNIRRIVNIITSLDVPSSDRELTIIPIKNAEATDIADKLNELLGSGQKAGTGSTDGYDLLRSRIQESAMAYASATRGAQAGQSGAAGAATSAGGKTVSARSREPKIIADERTNSVIVVADEDNTARIRALVAQLDSKVDLSGNKFYVYRCQHASADELAEVLSGLFGGSGSGGSGVTRTSSRNAQDEGLGTSLSGRNSGLSNNQSSRTSRSQDRLSTQSRSPGQSRRNNDRPSAGTVSLGDDMSITADPSTNSLIVSASKTDWDKIRALLEKLDIKRRQVLVEAMLLEVGVEESTAIGTEFITSTGGKDGGVVAKSDFGNLSTLLSDPTRLSNFSVAAASSGSLTLPGDITIPTQTILLSAARTNSNVNVLSAPTILATDNEEAEIVVGQNVPFLASQATSDENLNNTFNQIDRQDVGITLRITPQISSGDSVKLQIFTEVSNVVESTAQSDLGPTTTIRTSETTAITKDSQMVVIGGLMADALSDAESGVPFLKDVPLLGHFFKATRDNRRRTNLLIFITPRIVKDQFDAREVTLAKRDVLEDEILVNEIFPSRQEVLRNFDMDRVSESAPYDGTAPTTINAPVKSAKTSSEALAKNSALNSGQIELRVAPKLPGANYSGAAGLAPRAALVAPSLSKSGEQFVLLQAKTLPTNSNPDLTNQVPFYISPRERVFGLVVPVDSGPVARNFFRAGQQYEYQLDSGPLLATVLGVFGTQSEAQSFLKEANAPTWSWHTLSPHELMNLGQGPWLNRNR